MSCRWIMILALLLVWAVPVAAAPSPAISLDSWDVFSLPCRATAHFPEGRPPDRPSRP